MVGWLSIHCVPVPCNGNIQGGPERRKSVFHRIFEVNLSIYFLHPFIHLLCILLNSSIKGCPEQVIKSCSQAKIKYATDKENESVHHLGSDEG